MRYRNALLSLLLVVFVGISASAQNNNNTVKWTSSITVSPDGTGEMTFNAKIEPKWHIYAMQSPDYTFPDGAGVPTSVNFTASSGIELIGDPQPSRQPQKHYEDVFSAYLYWWENDITITQKFKLNPGQEIAAAKGYVRYMSCQENGACNIPANEPFELSASLSGAPVKKEDVKLEETGKNLQTTAVSEEAAPTAIDNADWWAPVDLEHQTTKSTWWHIIIWGFIGGLLALLTPCVWPMIPLTVSFFLKKSGSRKRSIGDALIYGGAILVIYLALGLAITVLFGAGKLNEMATNPVFNLFFFALLVVFAISFFGAFDIKLPAKWSNKMDSKAERTTGLISIFFMAFTLVLVSFSCTGPLIGTLLVEAASNNDITGPALGMGAFALALAIPFALFAIFPSMLKEMPRSGGWLNSVKVVLGFLELALSLKFLSGVDLAYEWGILDREIFLALWIVIFTLLGFYLLGKIRFSHDSPLEYVSMPRFFLALASFSFVVYMIPGLWGAPLKGISAFAPPLYTQDFNLYDGGVTHYEDYEEGMTAAAKEGKPVLIDFSGYYCVNCRNMEAAVFDDPQVKSLLDEKFVMITLMVDSPKDIPTPFVVEENGSTRTLKTYGEKWAYLQQHKFGSSSQPFYVMLDNKGHVIGNGSYSYDTDVKSFIEWLESGLKTYEK